MAFINIESDFRLSEIITKDKEIARRLDAVMQAGSFIVEQAYVDEAPGDRSGFKQGIQTKKNKALYYVIESTAKRNGRNYPLDLYKGTGKFKGQADAGYQQGLVRSTNNYGFGTSEAGREKSGKFFGMLFKLGRIKGIRPNKAALRAKKKSKNDYINFLISKIDLD